jgi:hypothetical protein
MANEKQNSISISRYITRSSNAIHGVTSPARKISCLISRLKFVLLSFRAIDTVTTSGAVSGDELFRAHCQYIGKKIGE